MSEDEAQDQIVDGYDVRRAEVAVRRSAFRLLQLIDLDAPECVLRTEIEILDRRITDLMAVRRPPNP